LDKNKIKKIYKDIKDGKKHSKKSSNISNKIFFINSSDLSSNKKKEQGPFSNDLSVTSSFSEDSVDEK